MRKNAWFGILIVSLCVLSLAVIYGCGANPTGGGGGGTTHGTYGYFGTAASGDAYSWIIGPSTFVGTNETFGVTITGEWSELPSGICYATVEYSSSPDAISVGGQAYFIELPNTALIVKPTGESDNVIVCAAKASTAPTSGQYNWIQIPWGGWTTAETAYGTVEVTAGTTYDFDVHFFLLSGESNGTTQETGYSWSDGVLSRAGSDLKIGFMPSGVFACDQGEGHGGFVGAVRMTATSTEAAAHNYRGVLFSFDSGTGDDTHAIAADPHGAGKLWGYDIDVNTGLPISADGITIEFGAQDDTGIISATKQETDGNIYPMKMLASQVNGKYIVFGVSSRQDGGYENFIVIQK